MIFSLYFLYSSCEYLYSFFISSRVWRKVEICSRFVLIRSKQKVGFHTECAPQLFYWTPHARCLIEIDDKGDKSNNSLELKTQKNTHQLDQFWNFLYPWKIVISRVKGVDVRSATRVLKAATIIFFVTWKLKQQTNIYKSDPFRKSLFLWRHKNGNYCHLWNLDKQNGLI